MTQGGAIANARGLEEFAADARLGLSRRPRELPSKYLYDALGSALFEAICRLPWYGVTRAETRLLSREVSRVVTDDCRTLVELGPGSGGKLAALLSRFCPDERPLTVHLVDLSPTALHEATRTLERIRGVQVLAHEATYEDGLEAFAEAHRTGPALALFLGSNIGNYAPAAAGDMLDRLRRSLRPGDGLLLGTDLVKSERRLVEAYDDPLGVTAAFNRNVLVRLNTELGARIDLDGFRHQAVWNREHARVEMHLVSLRSQRIVIPAAGLDFTMAEGETIWTESSYKYEPGQVEVMLGQAGFTVSAQWIDDVDRFAVTHAMAG